MTVTEVIQTNQVVPFTYQGSQVRTVQVDSEPFFVAKDVCEVLGIQNHKDAVRRLDHDEVRGSVVPTPSGSQEMIIINESGLYHLVFTSRLSQAKAFRKWVTSEVLPALRKHGRYEVGTPSITAAKGEQLSLWDLEPSNNIRMRDLMVDVALQAKAGSKLAQFLRLVKPLVMGGKGGASC
jgi:prophage antirepressor-like protein